jgi:hypothetical protein
MRALCVYETINFERGQDSITSMDIGIRGFGKLKERDIIVSKKEIGEKELDGNEPDLITFEKPGEPGHNYEPKSHMVIKKLKYKENGNLYLELIPYTDLRGAQEISRDKEHWGSLSFTTGEASPRKWSEFFDIVKINESLKFERGQKPIKAMGIGVDRKKDFDTMKEFIDYLILKIPVILKTNEIPKDIINQQGHNIRTEPINYFKNIKNYINNSEIKVNGNEIETLYNWTRNLKEKLIQMGFESAKPINSDM